MPTLSFTKPCRKNLEDRLVQLAATFERGLCFDKQETNTAIFRLMLLLFPVRQCTYLLYEPNTDHLWVSSLRDKGVLKLKISATTMTLVNNYQYEKNNPKKSRYCAVAICAPCWHETMRVWEVSPKMPVEEGYPNIESLIFDRQGYLSLGGEGLMRLNTQIINRS